MNLGNNLIQARKKVGLSQEVVAENLGVSRQTISKLETNETIPDIYQAKQLSRLYNLTLDELITLDIDIKEIEDAILNTKSEVEEKINWTSTWGKKYPVLNIYQNNIDIKRYAKIVRNLLDELKAEYKYNDLDSMLILKDILYHEWKENISNKL